MIQQYEGRRPRPFIFLDFIGLSEEEFLEVALSHQVSPNNHDARTIKLGEATSDFLEWNRAAPMPRTTKLAVLNEWRGCGDCNSSGGFGGG